MRSLRACASLCLLLVACGPSESVDAGPDAASDGGADAGSEPDGGPDSCDACDDGVFCNGEELCSDAGCSTGEPPCDGACDEEADRCETECSGDDADADGDGVISQACGGVDCDDTNPARHAGATEICDAEQSDEDCDPETFGVRDLDEDGWPDARCCDASGGTPRCGDDCDDARAGVHPSATEACNGLDDDCDGLVDDGVVRTFHPDADGDGFGDPGAAPVMGCSPEAGIVEDASDCDDTTRARNPGAPETCDSIDNDCDSVIDDGVETIYFRDSDGDSFGSPAVGTQIRACSVPSGYSTNSLDCDDTTNARNPAATEVCDGLDNNCNGLLDAVGEDPDGDGYTLVSCGGTDCDNTRGDVFPGAPEICDGRDNDCNGSLSTAEDVDRDGAARIACGGTDCDDASAVVFPGAIERCDALDNDCDNLFDGPGEDIDGDRFVSIACGGNDCDDTRATIRPGATELCNALDDDCNGTLMAGEDDDADAHADAACGGDDCDDTRANVFAGAAETCDGRDSNCNGILDAPGEDDDRDGTADTACGPACTGSCGDCNDTIAAVRPGAPELCNARDDDCDGILDGLGEDDDADGHADRSCAGCSAATCDDCDDTRADVHPLARPGAWPDGIDQDCDGSTDEIQLVNPPLVPGRNVFDVGQAQQAFTSLASGSEQIVIFADLNRGSSDLAIARFTRDDITTSVGRTYVTTDVDHTERDPEALRVGTSIGIVFRADLSGSWGLWYMRISDAGAVEVPPVSLGPVDAPLFNGAPDSLAYHRPHAVYNPTAGTIAVLSTVGDQWHRTMVRASDGAVVAAPIPIGFARQYGAGVQIGYNASVGSFIAAAARFNGTNFMLFVRPLTGAGDLVGTDWTEIAIAGAGGYGQYQPAIAADGGNFLIAYPSSGSHVSLVRLSPAAAIVTPPVSFPATHGNHFGTMYLLLGPTHIAVLWPGAVTHRIRTNFASVAGVYPVVSYSANGGGPFLDGGILLNAANANTLMTITRSGVY